MIASKSPDAPPIVAASGFAGELVDNIERRPALIGSGSGVEVNVAPVSLVAPAPREEKGSLTIPVRLKAPPEAIVPCAIMSVSQSTVAQPAKSLKFCQPAT